MTHLKQTLAMLLAMALMLAAFAGCGSTAASSAAQPASEAPAENTEQAAPEAPETPAAPAADSAAEPASTPEDAAPAEEDIPDLQLPLTDGATLSYWQTKPGGAVANMAPNGYFDYPHFQEAARLTGVTLDFIQSDFMVANEQFNLMIASQDYPDIFGNFNSSHQR